MKIPQFIPFGGETMQCSDVLRARIVVLPLCHEIAPSYGAGSLHGSLHLLEASFQLESLDDETGRDWTLSPVHTCEPLYPTPDPERAVEEMRLAALPAIEEGKFLLSLGGDHAISIGPIAAAASRYPDLGVVQIDAHLDLRDRWNGSRYNHACVMRRVCEDMGIDVFPVGTRSFCREDMEAVDRFGIKPVYAHAIDPLDDSWIERLIASLPETVYLTVDLDGLDPSVIPGTGTPEPGGLSYRQTTRLIQALGTQRNVVAADINELAKIPGTRVSETTAAKIATKIVLHGIHQR